jgi:S-adenosylmethionine/arginine decarboxylase-like enzyme
MSYWGYHLAIDAANPRVDLINDADNIAAFTKALVERIDMVAYGEPQIVWFGSGNKAGYTLVQLIETSNIAAHFVPDDQQGGAAYYLDVFSCKTFDMQTVVDTCREFFGNDSERLHYFVRQA